ncbi:MAG: FAD-dependent oxidoreductase [Candidatus Lernaella stagnicola]|nr:FAD-dependent oxidoreductase [Candidatus Lernaella stagnicola]
MAKNRAQRFPQPSGSQERLEPRKHAAVVGGGLAGVAAAVVLAERGASVTLIEREGYLGGRVGGWTDRLASGEAFEMERGFHAFFRQYYNLRELLKRIDPDGRSLTPLADYPIFGPDGSVESFEKLPRKAPWNVMRLVMRTPHMTFGDVMRSNRTAALEMLKYDPVATYRKFDAGTAREYLDSLNFPLQARRMLFDVFSHSFFNPEERMSAGELLMMFHFYFLGNEEGLIFDVLNEAFSDSLWRPFARYLQSLGVQIRLETTATEVTRREDGGWRVGTGNDTAIDADAVVLAVTASALQEIVTASPTLDDGEWRARVDGLALTLPFAVWRVWLDKPAISGRHPFVGTAGLGLLDNISLFELFEGESRRWALRAGGSVVELHAYAVPDERDEASIKAEFLEYLHELYPETQKVAILEERFLLRQDCPAFAPGSHATRPTVETPFDGLALAGDFVRLPIPSALMERATASGFMAANRLLASWDVRGEAVWSISRRGLFANADS